MKPESDDYRNPLTLARAPLQGQIIGAHSAVEHDADPGARAEWRHLRENEWHPIPAGTLVQVRRAAGRLQSFWFEEDGSVHGPLYIVTHAGAGARRMMRRSMQTGSRAPVVFGFVITLAMGVFVATLWHDLRFWSDAARAEVLVTLLVGWAALVAVGASSLRPERKPRRRIIEVAPPRRRVQDEPR